METIKPLTWEVKSSTHSIGETGDHETVVWIQKGKLQLIANDDDAEDELKEVVELLNDASSRVRALEEELLYLRHWRTDAEKQLVNFGKLKASAFDLEEENKRLQERLEAAEKDRDNWFKRYQDISYSKYGGTNP